MNTRTLSIMALVVAIASVCINGWLVYEYHAQSDVTGIVDMLPPPTPPEIEPGQEVKPKPAPKTEPKRGFLRWSK